MQRRRAEPRMFGLLAAAAVGLASLLGSVSLPAAAQDEADAALKLEEVVLFSSGVGFFEHRGEVQGDADVQLKFRVEDVNDLLKSMVVQDLGGGQVSTVAYGSKDPVSKALKSFAIDLTTEPSLGALLTQVRGEKIRVLAPNEIDGTIVSLEKRKVPVAEPKDGGEGGKVVEQEWLLLLTETGLRRVALDTVQQVQLMNPQLNEELQKALALMAESHATDKKQVTLRFRGQGDRPVRVGYIQEAPIWKTSYRLVLDEKKAPFLQGWAIVENTTEQDWSNVKLTLVSGRPISFVMNLYDPLYLARPEVQLELHASLRPRVYEQGLEGQEAEFAKKFQVFGRPVEPTASAATPPPAPPAKAAFGAVADGVAQGQSLARRGRLAERWDFQQGVQAAAQAGDVGELFRYAIEQPVDLPRQQSAMLPIVNSDVEGEKLSIYNEQVQAKHPLNGLRLKNTTELHLMQGPITVFDGGVYAGDAKIDDVPPGSERLVSYAMDLEVEVAPEAKSRPEELLSVRAMKGTLVVQRKLQRTHEYTVKNSGSAAKKVLIEYPLEPDWKLVAPAEPAEKTRSHYRFALEAKPGVAGKLAVELEQVQSQVVGLSDLEDGAIRMFQSAKVVSDEVKEVLASVVRRKAEIDQVAKDRTQREQEIAAIDQEQARIRENMARLDRTSELYNRYVKKFSEQEDRVETLREEIAGLQQKENELRKALEEYLMGLDVR